jgi:hypothetical protein
MSLVDSGARTEFQTGAMREIDEGVKGRCDLLPLDIMAVLAPSDILLGDDMKVLGDPILSSIDRFVRTHDIASLYDVILVFCRKRGWDVYTAMLELSIHFAEGAKKYSPNNWRKGLPIHSFIDSGVRHYLKWLRGDTDEPHDRAFLWNMVCCIWTFENKPEMMDLDEEE